MTNKKVLIIGLGLIGGSYACGLKDKGYEVGAISLEDSDIDFALKNGIIDSGTTKVDSDYISQFDFVVFALYPKAFVEWMNKNQQFLKPNSIITDVTGVKGEIVREISKIIRPDVEFIPSHPMAGREVSGVQNADKNIFKNANFIITPLSSSSDKAIKMVEQLAEDLEFKNIVRLSVDEHDEMIAYLSQLTHCIAISLMCCRDNEGFHKYSGDSFRDLTRIAKINENLWIELFLSNKEKLVEEMELFEKDFQKLKNAIINDDEKILRDMMIISTKRRGNFDKR